MANPRLEDTWTTRSVLILGFPCGNPATSQIGKDYFTIKENGSSTSDYKIYKTSASVSDSGILLQDKRTIVKIKNRFNNNVNEVEDGDIVGLLGWRVNYAGTYTIKLALAITYPYVYHSDGSITPYLKFVETIHLRSGTQRPL